MMTIDDMIEYINLNKDNNETDINGLFDYVISVQGNELLEDDFTMLKVIIE